MKHTLPYLTVFSLLVAGCGGGSDNASPSSLTNKAPVAVADVSAAVNSTTVTIDVLANDSDPDGDSLEITRIVTSPSNGAAGIEDNTVLYTPEVGYMGKDTFTYEISDGTATSQGQVEVDVSQTVSLSGFVTDGPISGAIVTISVSDALTEVQADNDGFFSATLTGTDPESMVKVVAKGSESHGQNKVELVNLIGSMSSLLENAGTERALSGEADSSLNVTQLSTARYLHLKDALDEQEPTSQQELDEALGRLRIKDVLDTAAFIRLLVDNPGYEISSEGLLALFESAESGATMDAVREYLASHELLNEYGSPTSEYSAHLSAAMEETLADAKVIGKFDSSYFSGVPLMLGFDAKAGWLPERAERMFILGEDGSGQEWYKWPHYQDITTPDWTPVWKDKVQWQVTAAGKLELHIIDNAWYKETMYHENDIFQRWGTEFGLKVRDATVEAGLGNPLFYDVIIKPLNIDVVRVGSEKYMIPAKVSYRYKVEVKPFPWGGRDPITTEIASESTMRLSAIGASLFSGKTLQDLEGSWVLPLEYAYFGGESEPRFEKDLVALQQQEAIAKFAGNSFVPSLDNGTLVLTEGTTQFRFTPYQQIGKGMLAYIEKWQDNQLQNVTTGVMAKMDDSYAQLTSNLITELPHAYISHINSYLPQSWDGDKLKLESIWGYQFNEDGTLRRGIYGVERLYLPEDNSYFSLGNIWNWNKEGRVVHLDYENDWLVRHRTWEVISVDDQGKAIVLEYADIWSDDNLDGEFSDQEKMYGFAPRINILTLDDLSRWENAWQNTLNKGLNATAPLGESNRQEVNRTDYVSVQ